MGWRWERSKDDEPEVVSSEKAYGPFQVLHEIVLTVQQGEFIVMVGPSGYGKSTLLKVIAGLERLNTGTIRVAAAGADYGFSTEEGFFK